jgi:hypothetical protein
MSDASKALVPFTPTTRQKVAKARFWRHIQETAVLNPMAMTNAQLATLSGCPSSFQTWWYSSHEFQSWWFDQDVAKQKVLAYAEDAVDKLHEIIHDPEADRKSQVNAAKVILENAGIAPPKQKQIEYKDKQIQSMDAGQLRSYVANKLRERLSTMTINELKEVLGDNLHRLQAVDVEEKT